jgi:hypothetical protein
MPKLRNPLQSGGAAGKLNEETVLSNYQGRTYSKRFTPPKQPNTKAQKETYARMSWAMKLWQRWLTEDDREAWRGYARRRKRVDRLTGADVRAPGHTVFVGSAIQCRRAGFEAPRKPPSGPEPQPVGLGLVPKGKGLLIQWDTDLSAIFGPSYKANPKDLLSKRSGDPDLSGPKVELRMAVTPAWVRPYESLFRTLAFIPLSKGQYFLSPIKRDMRYSFLSRIIAPNGYISRPSHNFLIL